MPPPLVITEPTHAPAARPPRSPAAARTGLRRLVAATPYLVLAVMPGGFMVLPIYAWWRRTRRRPAQAATPLGYGEDIH